MKKKSSRWMAFILLISMMIPMVGPIYEAQAAASLTLRASFEDYLRTNSSGGARPEFGGASAPDGHALLYWNLNDSAVTGGFASGMYVLRYHKSNGDKVELTVENLGRYLQVNYDVYKYDGSAYVNINQPGRTYEPNDLRYSVYVSSRKEYINIDRYFKPTNFNGGTPATPAISRVNNFDPYDTANVPNDYILQTNNEAVYDELIYRLAPSFNIEIGGGYSFLYDIDNTEVHFYWDNNGQFYFGTNNIDKGNIYDCKLEYYPGSAVAYYKTYLSTQYDNATPSGVYLYSGLQYVFAGIFASNVAAIPFARSDNTKPNNTLNDIISKEIGYDLYPDYYNTDYLDITEGENPAVSSVGLDFRFDMPKSFDIATHSYKVIPDNVEYELWLDVVMSHSAGYFLTVRIDGNRLRSKEYTGVDDTGPADNPVGWLIDPRHGEVLTDVSLLRRSAAGTVMEPDRVRIRLDNLQAGLVYSSTEIRLTHKSSASNWTIKKPADISSDYGQVYTFPEFNLVNDGSQQYITLTPFGMNTNQKLQGWYRLYSLNSFSYMELTSTGDSILRFPLPAGTESSAPDQYQVRFSRTGKFENISSDSRVYYSQIVDYVPMQKTASVGVPNHFSILKNPANHYTLRPLENHPDGKQGELTFWAQWDIGLQEHIDQLLSETADDRMTITYALANALAPSENHASFDASTMLVDVTIFRSGADLMVTYSDNLGMVANTDPQPLLTFRDTATTPATVLYYAEICFVGNAAHNEVVLNPAVDPPTVFRYPNIYYVKVVPDKLTRNLVDANGDPYPDQTPLRNAVASSVFDYMTLDDLSQSRLEVPPPQDLMVTPENDRPALTVDYIVPGRAVASYIDSQYAFSPEVTVDLYIGQFEQHILNTFYPPTEDSVTVPASIPYDARLAASYQLSYTGNAINGVLDMGALPDALAVLRGDAPGLSPSGVVCIRDVPLLANNGQAYPIDQTMAVLANGNLRIFITLTGLDANRQYYVFADLTVKEWEDNTYQTPKADNGQQRVTASILTNRAGATTTDDLTVLDPSEKVPSSPKLDVYRDRTSQTSATLYWDAILGDPGEVGVTIEYELIRLKNQQMPEEAYNSTEKDVLQFLAGIENTEKVAWRTDNGEIARLFPAGVSDLYVYDGYGEIITFKDGSLLPNQLYFYYARTVRTMPGREPTYSSWSRTSVTTSPIQGPYNLKVDTNSEYDRKTEVIVGFDIPALDIDRLGIDYIIQYQIKPDNGEWSGLIDMDLAQLTNPDNYALSANGLTLHFTYKLSGLTPNMLYSMRVRLYDIKSGDGSLYSNIAQFKTNLDQEEYDDQHDMEEWLNYLRKLLTKLLTEPYWTARETASDLVVVYRPGDMFSGLLNAAYDSAIALYTNDADSITYYLPATVLMTANNANKGFRLSYDDLDVLFSPKSVNTNYNDAVSAMADYIKAKNVGDYFLRISVTRSRVTGLLDGEQALGRQVEAEIDLVGVKPDAVDINTWDNSLYLQFAKIVDEKLNDPTVRADLMKQIQEDAVSQTMINYIEKLANDNKTEMLKAVYAQLNTGSSGILSTRAATVTKLDAPMIVVAKGVDESSSVSGYQLQNGVWMPRPVSDYYNGKALSATTPGIYAFTGRTVNIPGVDGTANGGAITALTAKYGLDDYLGRDAVNLRQNASRLMVAGCVARLAGAPKTADPVTWVSSNLNMTLSSRNKTSYVQTQEALAMVMALYEKKTNTKVSSIAIRNFNSTANMTGLDKRYTQAVRAAFEVGLVSDTTLAPTGAVTIGTLLDMLAALDAKVKL